MRTKNKSKLNLTINEKLIPRSKMFAKKQGKSVSQLVEELLIKALDEEKNNFTKKWLGKLSVSDKKDSRTEFLKDRYQL